MQKNLKCQDSIKSIKHTFYLKLFDLLIIHFLDAFEMMNGLSVYKLCTRSMENELISQLKERKCYLAIDGRKCMVLNPIHYIAAFCKCHVQFFLFIIYSFLCSQIIQDSEENFHKKLTFNGKNGYLS